MDMGGVLPEYNGLGNPFFLIKLNNSLIIKFIFWHSTVCFTLYAQLQTLHRKIFEGYNPFSDAVSEILRYKHDEKIAQVFDESHQFH